MSHKRYNAYQPLATSSELARFFALPMIWIDRALKSVGRANDQIRHSYELHNSNSKKSGPFG